MENEKVPWEPLEVEFPAESQMTRVLTAEEASQEGESEKDVPRLLPVRKTPTERKMDAVVQASMLIRNAMSMAAETFDEFSLVDPRAAVEMSGKVMDVLREAQERIEQQRGKMERNSS